MFGFLPMNDIGLVGVTILLDCIIVLINSYTVIIPADEKYLQI